MNDQEIVTIHWENRRFNYGMTRKEIRKMLKKTGIKSTAFWNKFGMNTCAFDAESKEVLHYLCDIELAVKRVREKRNQYSFEMD